MYQFLRGESPEGIVQSFPSLSLEQVYGAITFYLAHRAAIDAYLRQGELRFDELARASREANPLLYEKLQAARRAGPELTKPRFQADENFNAKIIAGLLRRERSIDFQTAKAARLFGLPDPDVLAIAAREGRILVSHDRRTMSGCFSSFIEQTTSSGLLSLPRH